MRALLTFANAGWPDRILRWRDPAARALFAQRHERAVHGEESLRVFASFHSLFESIHALECFSLRRPAFFRKVPGVEGARYCTRTQTPNKGIREFLNIAGFLDAAGWSPGTVVVKCTGRYLLRRPDFLEWCANSKAPAVVRRDDDVWGERGRGVHTFLFAARVDLLREFARWLVAEDGPSRFGRNPIEWIFYEFLLARKVPVDWYPQRLHVLARYAPPLKPLEV